MLTMRHNLLQMDLKEMIYASMSAKQIQSLQAMTYLAGQRDETQKCSCCVLLSRVALQSVKDKITNVRYNSLCLLR